MAYLAYLRGQGFFIVAAILLRRVKSCSQSAAMQVTHRDCGNAIGKEKERMKREREREDIWILQRGQKRRERGPPLLRIIYLIIALRVPSTESEDDGIGGKR